MKLKQWAKIDAEGNVLEIGNTLRLGSGEGEELRNTAAFEMQQGMRIIELWTSVELPAITAVNVIERVMAENNDHHVKNSWLKLSTEEHLKHAALHLQAARKGKTNESHIEHALCRIAMALTVRHRALGR